MRAGHRPAAWPPYARVARAETLTVRTLTHRRRPLQGAGAGRIIAGQWGRCACPQ